MFVNGVNLGKNLNNKVYTIGTEELVLNIVVKPAVYNVTISESIYNNLSDLDNSTPTETTKDMWINGYTDNQIAEFGTKKAVQFNYVVKNDQGRNHAQLYEVEIVGGCSKAYYVKDNKLYIDEACIVEVDFIYTVDTANNKVVVNAVDYSIINNSISIPTSVNIKIVDKTILYLVNGVWVENNPTNYTIQLSLRNNKLLVSYDPTLDIVFKLNYLDYKSINSGI